MVTDFLGTELKVGSRVVYPAGGKSRSVQMVEGTVLEFEVCSAENYAKAVKKGGQAWADRYHPLGELAKMKVLPTGRTSRWRQHYGNLQYNRETREYEGELRPVTLTINARSVVVVG